MGGIKHMEQHNEENSQKVNRILEILERTYPGAKTELEYKDSFQLLIATMLSAQTTDKQVNKVTPELFRRFPDPCSVARASVGEIEEIIKTCGFYKTKAVNIKEASRIICERYNGQVPSNIDQLTSAAGGGQENGKCGFKQRLRQGCHRSRYPCFSRFKPYRACPGQECNYDREAVDG
jgi:endonuclease III